MTRVPFLTVEEGDDLIVSFPLGQHAQESLTLLRTPKYEPLWPVEERGVSVSRLDASELERNLLLALKWESSTVWIHCEAGDHVVDVSRVDDEEVRDAKRVLRKMNFDGCFDLRLV